MPSRRAAHIPTYSIKDSSPIGVEVHAVDFMDPRYLDRTAHTLDAHRDDHYIFIVLKSGSGSMMVDFQQCQFTGPGIFFILPGQVHQYSGAIEATGWFMAADSLLVNDQFQQALNAEANTGPLPITAQQLEVFENACALLRCQLNNAADTAYARPVIHSLVTAFAGMTASIYAEHAGRDNQGQRSAAIAGTFRQLLAAQYKTMKSPVDYARKMNLSLSYLNEVVKNHTGFPVSYWIQQEAMLEARRLLYYTQMSIKEVAYELGYDDPTYFSRLFKKVVQQSPGDYRKQYRE